MTCACCGWRYLEGGWLVALTCCNFVDAPQQRRGAFYSFPSYEASPALSVNEILSALLPGVGTVALAMLSGAGGSTLLELYWKPRNEKRKVAAVLMADILLNTELLILQAHARFKNLKSVPPDLRMSLMGWDSAAGSLRELPAELIKSLVLLCNRYRYMNDRVDHFTRTYDKREATPAGDVRRITLERELALIIDVFNTSIDKAIEDGKAILPQLLELSGVKEQHDASAKLRDYAKDVDRLLADREERVNRLNAVK